MLEKTQTGQTTIDGIDLDYNNPHAVAEIKDKLVKPNLRDAAVMNLLGVTKEKVTERRLAESRERRLDLANKRLAEVTALEVRQPDRRGTCSVLCHSWRTRRLCE